MRVFVTGATGFVGQEILRQLHAAGHRIRILARNRQAPAVRAATDRFGAEVHPGNALETKSLSGALTGCEAVIHLIGIISEVRRQTFEAVHVQATRNVLAAARSAGVRRFIHMSALGTRPNAAARYHQTKWAAEEAVRQSGLDWTIFRPSLIYGAADHFVNQFARMARTAPCLPVIGSGRTQFQPVAVENVAAAFVRSLPEPRAVGREFDLCGPDRLTLPEILRAILTATGRRRPLVTLPLPLACMLAVVGEVWFSRLLGQAAPLNRDQLLMLQEDNVGDATPAWELFGIQPTPFREGIARYLDPHRSR